MANGKLPTVAELITEIREDLDEALDTATNFWSDDYLLARFNRGVRQVYATARETKENWFVRTLRSDDEPLPIFGRSYDPAQLAVTAGATSLVLPPDYAEALAFEALPASGETVAGVSFAWTPVTTNAFQEGKRVSSTNSVVDYAVDVTFGDGGPRLVLSPAAGDDLVTVDTVLTYVYAPPEYAADDGLEQGGFTRVMLDAAVAYAVLEACRKEKVATSIALAQAAWVDKIGLVTRTSGPRQSRSPEVVEGFLEEWT